MKAVVVTPLQAESGRVAEVPDPEIGGRRGARKGARAGIKRVVTVS